MATVTEKPQPPRPPQAPRDAQEKLVDQQVNRTRRALKLVDVTAGLITLAIGVLAYLLTMSVLEHWVIPGGWSDPARFFLFALLILCCAWYSWRTFWPLLSQPINPVFAANAIEQSSPSLKNSLLNLLLLRGHKREMSRQVYQAIESQAAQGLSQVRMETVVDRSAILRLGYILVALTAVSVLYRVLSPKDLFSSAGRVLMPWSDIATPSRVSISNVTPGNTKTARGEQLKISAEIFGLEEDEPVKLLYSTADEQIVKQEIPMSAGESGIQFSCKVPSRLGGGDRRGVQQDFTYWIEAGDARSPRYNVQVFARPTLVVTRLRYDYPSYTGFPSREVEHTGDIRAVEGTRVTVFAQANKPIKAAHVDFDADGRNDLLMNSKDQQASVTFPLGLREDRRTPLHRSYMLKYTTTDGNRNQLPPKYPIDVQPDYAPEIQLLLPEEPMLEVALNKEIEFELEARDPDFALSQVLLVGQVGEEQKLQEPLLAKFRTGKFVGKLRKTPEEMGLKPGDVLEYWGAAADNRQPEPNLAYSAHRKIRVVGPWQGNDQGGQNQEGEGQQQGEGGESQDGEGGQDGQAGGGEQGNSSEGEGQEGAEGQSGQGQEGGQQGENDQQQNGGQAGADGSQEGNNETQGGANGQAPNDNSQDNSGENSGEQNNTEQDDNGQPSENSSGGDSGEQGKVSPDGDDDGEAFDRMADHFNEQENKSDGNEGAAGENSEQNNSGEADPNREQSGEGGQSPDNARDGQQSTSKEGAQQDQPSAGEGAQGEPAPGEERQQGEGEQQPQEGESPAGEMSPEQGNAGAGDQKGEQQGAPNTEETKHPSDKQGDQGDGPEEQNSEAAAKADDNSESDSEGGESGDRSGGGKDGGGQQADESGKGAAGQNEAAEDGAGKSSEQGEGETGEQAGEQDKAAGKTGQSSGDQKGEGSEQSEKPGEKPDGESPSDGQPSDDQQGQQGQPGENPGQSQSNDGQSAPQGDQQPQDEQQPQQDNQRSGAEAEGSDAGGSGDNAGRQPEDELLPGDKANLDYANKQTDLILERLEDQLKKKEVDEGLLEKLGWNQDDLRRFVDRWKNLKSQPADDTGGSDELNDALRSLGLNPNRRTGYNSKITKDKLRDLQEAYRGRVPLEYQEQINRYRKGTASSQENE